MVTEGAAFDPSGGDVLRFALQEREAGRPAVIITLTAIEGRSPRAIGAQMAVAADGRYIGSISSGCLERAIVDRARMAIEEGKGGVERYGAGSRFFDVKLPCGSGVDLLFTLNPEEEVLAATVEAQLQRRPAALRFDVDGVRATDQAEAPQGDAIWRTYLPRLRVAAAGIGVETVQLTRLASAAGYDVCALSPDRETLDACVAGEKIILRAGDAVLPAIDVWTACVFTFHDREWELELIPATLKSLAFFVGAVGSPRTHAARLDALREQGTSDALLERLRGPIGLIPSTRDPSALAVSVLSEVVAAWPF